MIPLSFVAADDSGPIRFRSAEFSWRRDRPRSIPVYLDTATTGTDMAVSWSLVDGANTLIGFATSRGGRWSESRLEPDWNGYTAPACQLLADDRAAVAWGGPAEGVGYVLDREGNILDRHRLDLRAERLTMTVSERELLIGGARSAPRRNAWNPLTQPHGSWVRVQVVPIALTWSDGTGVCGEQFDLDDANDHTPAVVTNAGVVFGRMSDEGRATLFAVRDGERELIADGIDPGAGEWFDATADATGLYACYRDGSRLVTVARTRTGWETVGVIGEARASMGLRIAARDGTVHVCWWQFGSGGAAVFVASCSGGTVSERRRIGRGGGAAIGWSRDRLVLAWARELRRTRTSSRHRVEIVELPR